MWRRLPWISGVIVTAILPCRGICWPSRARRVFSTYFIIGGAAGNWRYAEAGWKGDVFGTAHARRAA